MSDGPIACQTEGGAAGMAAAPRRTPARGRPLVLDSAAAALAIAAAKGFAAGGACRLRPRAAALAALTGLARKALFVSPNFGRAAFGTAMVATTSSLSLGSRSPR